MSGLATETVLTLSSDASIQGMGDGAVVLLASSGQLHTCNETSQAFIEKVDGTRSLDAIVSLLCEEFEVDPATASGDFHDLARELLDEGILVDVGHG